MDRLLSIEIFVQAVKAGSFTQTAEKFSITPAMVGKHIKSLEQQVGATLLRRTTRKQSLTEIGQEYFLGCQKILNEYAQLEQKTATFTHSPSGTLKINSPVTFGSLVLSPIICKLLDKYPKLNVELDLSDTFVDVVHDGFDFVVRVGQLEDASYIARKIGDYEMVFCASPNYLNQHGVPSSLKELNQHQWLGLTYWGYQSKLAQNFNTKGFDISISRFSSNNGMALKSAALQSWGVVLQPKILLEKEIESGELVEILSDFKPASLPIYLLYHSRVDQPLKVQIFIEHLLIELDNLALSASAKKY